MRRRADWTVSLDCALAGRLTTCTQCGRPYQAAWFKLYTSDAGLVLPIAQCRTCQAHDPEGKALTAMLDARYGP